MGWEQSHIDTKLDQNGDRISTKLESATKIQIQNIINRIREGRFTPAYEDAHLFSASQRRRLEQLRRAWLMRGDRDHLFHQRDPEMFIQVLIDQAESMCEAPEELEG